MSTIKYFPLIEGLLTRWCLPDVVGTKSVNTKKFMQ